MINLLRYFNYKYPVSYDEGSGKLLFSNPTQWIPNPMRNLEDSMNYPKYQKIKKSNFSNYADFDSQSRSRRRVQYIYNQSQLNKSNTEEINSHYE